MNMRIIKGTIIGGALFFFLGWLVWGILLSGFMAENTNQAFNRPENEMVWWALIISNLLLGLLMTLVLKWSGVTTVKASAATGAIFGLLYALTIDLSMYSMTTMTSNLMVIIVDAIVYSVLMALISVVIVTLWGKE
jgi:hypothetical protein